MNLKNNFRSTAYFGSRILNFTIGDYSYCDRYADIANANIGKFSNIESYKSIGPTDHPMTREEAIALIGKTYNGKKVLGVTDRPPGRDNQSKNGVWLVYAGALATYERVDEEKEDAQS